jgi:hypothetical protein
MVNAHFRLTLPPHRGPFNAADKVNLCGNVVDLPSIRVLIFGEDNYMHAVDKRSEFPLVSSR